MMSLLQLIKQAGQDKSIYRMLMNRELQQWRTDVGGVVLDLASGQMPSYRRVLGLMKTPSVRMIGVDYKRELRPQVVADMQYPLPFKDKIADIVIISSFLYIHPEPKELLNESRRLLKPKGMLLLTVPLIYPHNPEPTDYWRFTDEGLRLLLNHAGFNDFTIIPFGGRWSAAVYLLSPFLRPRKIVAPVVYWMSIKLDTWTDKSLTLPKCPIGYVVKARPSV